MTTNYAVMLRNLPYTRNTGEGGGVSSVGLTLSTELALVLGVSNSPITSSGNIALDLDTQTANLVFASPANGSAAKPSFRSLVAADIPDLSAVYAALSHTHAASAITSGTLDDARLSSNVVTLDGAQTLTNKSIAATQLTGTLQAGQFPALTGDVTTSAGSLATTLATVNSNVGSFALSTVTVNAKGQVTAASAAATTGSGSVVLASSPTIVTPTVASLTNMQHTHQDAAGGGTLSAAAVASGTLSDERLSTKTRTRRIGAALLNPAAGTYIVGRFSDAATITKQHAAIVGGTNVVFYVAHGTDLTSLSSTLYSGNQTETSTTTGTTYTSFNDATLAANEWVALVIVSVSGSVTQFATTFDYTIDP